jgi:hypothetical protein
MFRLPPPSADTVALPITGALEGIDGRETEKSRAVEYGPHPDWHALTFSW